MKKDSGFLRVATSTRFLLAAFILITVVLGYISASVRLPFDDEGFYSDPARHLAKDGFMGMTVKEEAGVRFDSRRTLRADRHVYWVLPGQVVGLALWFTLLPASALTARLFSVLWATVAVVSTYGIVKYLTRDRATALLASGFLAVDSLFLGTACFARPDVMCMALGLGGIASYLNWRERNLVKALLFSNALMALSALTHPNALLHFAVFVFLVLRFDWKRIGIRQVAAAGLPYLALFAAYAVYVAQDPEAFRAQMEYNLMSNDRIASTLNPVKIVAKEIRERYVGVLGFSSPRLGARLQSVTILSSVAALFILCLSSRFRRLPGFWLIFGAWALTFAIQCVFNQKIGEYIVHILPYYLALLSMFLVAAIREHPKLRLAAAAFCVSIVALNIGLNLVRLAKPYKPAEDRMLTFIREKAGKAHLIFGSAGLVFGFHFDRRLLDDRYLGVRSGKTGDVAIMEWGYKVRNDDDASRQLPDWARAISRLKEYRLVFDNGAYQVYFNPKTMPIPGTAGSGGS